MEIAKLSKSELTLLEWLSEEDECPYGSCSGKSLDRLIELGYAKFSRIETISLTENGWGRLRSQNTVA